MIIADIYKLKWRCRLGTLELDLLFNSYVDKKADTLSSEKIKLLYQLLDNENNVLESWLISKTEPIPLKYQFLCREILEYNKI